MQAYRIKIHGIVQSVGFRPFIYRLFKDYTGWVKNTPDGVVVYLEAPLERDDIIRKIKSEKPPNAKIDSIDIISFQLKRRVFNRFSIKESEEGFGNISIPPDLGICDECSNELLDKNNRRFLHPFINCTHCGPRFSIITGVPYDRNKTTMADFRMCQLCREEYKNPLDRRFHAQPIACKMCGPDYFLIKDKKVIAKNAEALKLLSNELANGAVALVKGIGGYHLLCDAYNEQATRKIRTIKNREQKPFAVMANSMETVEKICWVNNKERELLLSQIKPIVLLKIKNQAVLRNIRYGSPYLGVMLPYTPMHLLLFHFSPFELIVATSANISEKPLIFEENEANNFPHVNLILTNNRRITRPLEDSIVQVVNKKYFITRYARGFAPGTFSFLRKKKPHIIALGGDLKNNIALAVKDQIILSQYTGDLSEYDNYRRFAEKIYDLLHFLNIKPDLVVCDKHPEYFSTRFALENFKNVRQVQHHKAHFGSVLLEHGIQDDAIGIIMDGTGYGTDEKIWGGEFFIKKGKKIERIAHIENMPFAFGDRAIREPFRLAAVWLYEVLKDKAFAHPLFTKYPFLKKIVKDIQKTQTSSAGRWFDVASTLLGIKEKSSFEAETAMYLTYRAMECETKEHFEYRLNGFNINFKPMIEQLFGFYDKKDKSTYASAFHNTFINALIETTLKISGETGIKAVALSGGVFQNEIVLSKIVNILEKTGIKIYYNSKIPINDAGIAMGQIYIAQEFYT